MTLSCHEAEIVPFIRRFSKDQAGATLVEYGIMVALISVFLLTIVAVVGHSLESKMGKMDSELRAGEMGEFIEKPKKRR